MKPGAVLRLEIEETELQMTENAKTPKRPTHIISQVIGDDDKARWVRVGAGWLNKDGKGVNLVFDSYPIVGRIVIREVTEESEKEAGAQ